VCVGLGIAHVTEPRKPLAAPAAPRAALRRAGPRVLLGSSDERLVALARAGDEQAFAAIVERYRAPLQRYCQRFLPPVAADDALQQTLINTYAALSGDAGAPVSLRPWLYRVAHNAALNVARDPQAGLERLPETLDGVARPDEVVQQRDRLRRVVLAVSALPAKQRQVIVRHAFEGDSHERIATDLGMTSGAIRQLAHRARRTVRQAAAGLLPAPLLRLLPWQADVGAVAPAASGGAAVAKVAAAVVLAAAAGGGAFEVSERGQGPGARSLAPAGRSGSAMGDGSARGDSSRTSTSNGSGAAESGTGRGRSGSVERGTRSGGPGHRRGPGGNAGGRSGPRKSGSGSGSRSGSGMSGSGSGGSRSGSGGSGSGSGGSGSGSGTGESGSGGSGSGSGTSGSGSGETGSDSGTSGSGSGDSTSGSGTSGSGSGSSGSGSGTGESGSEGSGSGSGESGSGSDSSGSGSGGSGSGSDSSGSGSGGSGSGSDSSGSGSGGSGSGSGGSGSGSGERAP